MRKFQPTRFGKYLLLERVASGGMAELYRAKIVGVQGFEKFIAIKQILPNLANEKELIGSFIDEAKLAALLNHQNIVQIYDFGHVENTYFITMEYLLGKDLRVIESKLKEKGLRLSLEHCLYIISRICSGLDYAHKLKDFHGKPLNIIHRDISPQNVILTYEGEVKIVDFGIAKARSQSTFTQVGMIKGKVAYMSPEQAAGEAIDHRSDIFSGGILLYEILSGKRMFTGDSMMQVLSKVREAEFEPPELAVPGLPAKLYKILRLALAKKQEERYQSCGEMLADVEEYMFDLSLRPTARGLAQFMRELFKEEIAKDEQVLPETLHACSVDETNLAIEGVVGKEEDEKPAVMAKGEAPRKRINKGVLYAVIAAILLIVIGSVIAFWPATKPPALPDPVARTKALITEASGLVETNPEKAKALLIEAVKLDPSSREGHSLLAKSYLKLGDYSNSIETYDRAGQLDPRFADTFFNLGYIYAKKKDYVKAEEMYNRVVQLAPTYLDEALYMLGVVQAELGKRKQSMENLERALKVNPNNEVAKKFLNRLKGEP